MTTSPAQKDNVELEEFCDEETAKHTKPPAPGDRFGAVIHVDPEEARLVKKLDWFIMPITTLMYFLNYLDRNALVNGKLDSLSEDLGLEGSQYNTIVAILFVGYLLGQIPSNMLLNRVRPSRFMAGFMTAWSLVSLLSYLAYDYKTMLVLRLILGFTEAPFYPGALYMLGIFYTRKEISFRMAILFVGSMAANAFSGLIAAPIFSNLGGVKGLAGWQWLFIIQGAISLAVSLSSFFILPDLPRDTWWLSRREREVAATRMARDTTRRTAEPVSVWEGLRQACVDPRTWVFSLMYCLHCSATGFKNFMPTAVASLGIGGGGGHTTESLALTCPPYVLATVVALGQSWLSGRQNERTWHITGAKAVAVAGFAMCAASADVGVRYAGMMVFVGASYGVNNLVLGWTASAVGESDEKKAVAIAIVNMIGNVASVYTPYLWPDADAPRFVAAMVASVAFCAGTVGAAWAMRGMLVRTNRKMRRADPATTNFYVY